MEENKQEVVVDQRKVIKISKKKFIIGIVVIAILGFIVLLANSGGDFYMFYRLFVFIIPIALGIAVIFFIWGLIQYFSTADPLIQSKARPKITWGIISGILFLVLWGATSLINNSLSIGADTLDSNNMPCIPNPYVNPPVTCDDSYSNSFNSKIMNPLGSSSNYYRDNSNTPTIGDTREFLKTSYDATIKTRDVSGVVKEVKNIVKGHDGRIDNFNSTPKYGYVRFVVAKSKFDAFRDEVEAITHKKLYIENISAQNLLSQKQGIEEQTTNTINTLEGWNAQLDNLNTNHTKTVSTINKELASIKNQLTSVRASMATTIDTIVLTSLSKQETALLKQESIQKTKLSNENTSYSNLKQQYENQIANWNQNLTNVIKEDVQFTDNIETVNGTIDVTWVSLWEMARIFSPIPPFWIIVIIIIIIGIFLKRSNKIPRVEFQ